MAVQQLRKAGFTVDDRGSTWPRMFSWRTKKDPANAGGWHIFNTGWGGVDMMNPATNVFMTGACDKAWFGWACDEEMQKLRAAFFAAKTDAERKDIAIKLQARAHDVVPFVNDGPELASIGGLAQEACKGIDRRAGPMLWNVTKRN